MSNLYNFVWIKQDFYIDFVNHLANPIKLNLD